MLWTRGRKKVVRIKLICSLCIYLHHTGSENITQILLLIRSGEQSHYVGDYEFKQTAWKVVSADHGNEAFVCKFCLYSFKQEHSLMAHEEMCSQHPAQKVTYPTQGENVMKFKNFGNSLEVPFTIYADFETLVIPNDDVEKTKKTCSVGGVVFNGVCNPGIQPRHVCVHGARRDGEILWTHR